MYLSALFWCANPSKNMEKSKPLPISTTRGVRDYRLFRFSKKSIEISINSIEMSTKLKNTIEMLDPRDVLRDGP